jgi:hypothetical protein
VTGGGGFGRPDLVSDPVLPKKYQVIGDGHTAYPLPDGSTIVVPARRLLYFNPHAFRSRVVQTPVAGSTGQTQNAVDLYWYGNSPRYISNLRQPGLNVWNMALSRTFRLTEKTRLEFRCDAQNALNHNIFFRPVVAFGSTYLGKGALSQDFVGTSTTANFGTIDTTAAPLRPPRYLQLSARIAW